MSSGKALQSMSTHHNQQTPTSSLAKRKMIQSKCEIRSPTDNVMSPCTRQLMKRAIKDIPSSPRPIEEGKENSPNK